MSKKTSTKENIGKLKDEDLFGDFKDMDEFIDSDNSEVIDENAHKPGTFEITSKDKKKKAGHAKPPEEKTEETADNELFGDFKSLEEFENSENFDVTKSKSDIKTQAKAQSKKVGKKDVNDDDLFGEFKSLEEFERSESFEVTKSKDEITASNNKEPKTMRKGGFDDDDLFGDFKSLEEFEQSESFEVTKTSSSQSPLPQQTGPSIVNSEPPGQSFALKKAQQSDQKKELEEPQPEIEDPVKQKLATIAANRKKKKSKGSAEDLFSDLDDFDLEDD